MRLPLLLLLFALVLPASALAQDANTTDEGNATPPAGNQTPPEPSTDETAVDPPVVISAPPPIEIVLVGHQDPATYFTLEGETQRNPTIRVEPGQQVRFVFKIASGLHNLRLATGEKTPVSGEGQEVIEWTAPSEPGTVEYWCDPHKAVMRGIIQVGSAAPPPPVEEGEITGETIDLGQYDPACAGRKAPAVVTTGIVGSPTLDDYIQACKATGGDEVATKTRDRHGADLVIPLSWALIALGIGGIVWVHKYYKP